MDAAPEITRADVIAALYAAAEQATAEQVSTLGENELTPEILAASRGVTASRANDILAQWLKLGLVTREWKAVRLPDGNIRSHGYVYRYELVVT